MSKSKVYTFESHGNQFLDDQRETITGYNSLSYGSLFKVIFMTLFFVMFIQYAFNIGTGYMSFRGFLEMLEGVPDIDISWIAKVASLQIVGDWGLIDFIRSFLNTIMKIFATGLYISTGIAQLIVFVGYVLGFLMGVV